jgi:hypothetical protein
LCHASTQILLKALEMSLWMPGGYCPERLRFSGQGSLVVAASPRPLYKEGVVVMALEVLSEEPDRRYSNQPLRSLIAMFSRRATGFVHGPARHALVKPFIVFAARALGPGPTRLRLVKLAHNLDRQPLIAMPHELYEEPDIAAAHQPSRRAA